MHVYVSEVYIILLCFPNFRGMYLCRTLSYKGAEFDIIEATLDDKMTVWQLISLSILQSQIIVPVP
jgi:hypothetical protein